MIRYLSGAFDDAGGFRRNGFFALWMCVIFGGNFGKDFGCRWSVQIKSFNVCLSRITINIKQPNKTIIH